MGRTAKRKAKKPTTTTSTEHELRASGSIAAAATSSSSPPSQPRRSAGALESDFIAAVSKLTVGGPTPEQREVLAGIASMISSDADSATKELAVQKYWDLMVDMGKIGRTDFPVDSNGESFPLRFFKDLVLGPDHQRGAKAAGGSSTAESSPPTPAASATSPSPGPRHSESAPMSSESVNGVRGSVLRRIDKWIVFGPDDPDLREANFCARQVLIAGEIHTEDEVSDAWNDFFDTLDDCQLHPSTLDDIRDNLALREHILQQFAELQGKCTCTDCDDVDLKQIEALGDGAVYCPADLDDEERYEISAARRYNGWFDLKPTKPSPSDRKALLHLANRRRKQWDDFPGLATSLRLFGMRKPFSTTPLHDLKPIRIDEMLVTKTHKGRYLLCRIISRPAYKDFVSFVVEDQDGRAESVYLHNVPTPYLGTGTELDDLFPLGQTLVIREPTLVRAFDDRSIAIRVDSPIDYALLPRSAALLEGAQWRTDSPAPFSFVTVNSLHGRGNAYLAARSASRAVQAFSDALALDPTPKERLLLAMDRSNAHYSLGNFSSCYRDGSIVLTYLAQGVAAPDGTEVSIRLRRGLALMAMRRFEPALKEYERILETHADNFLAKNGKATALRALAETRAGSYNWRRLEESLGDVETYPVGDFVGPVKVVSMSRREGGRGVVATRDVKAGELLLVESALAVGTIYTEQYGYDLATETLAEATAAEVVNQLVKKIVDDPAIVPLVNALYAGAAYPPTEDLSFDEPNLGEPSLFPMPAYADIARLEAIVLRNALDLDISDPGILNFRTPFRAGLFHYASAFNHSCGANARISRYTRCVAVRARSDIKAGTEVTVPYFPPDGHERMRAEMCRTHFGSPDCVCEECATDRHASADTLRAREQVIAEFQKFLDRKGSGKATYSKQLLSFPLARMYEATATMSGLQTADDFRSFVENGLKALECRGARFDCSPSGITVLRLPVVGGDYAHMRFLTFARDYVEARFPSPEREVRKWLRAAWQASKLAYGWTWDDFCATMAGTIELFDLQRFVASSRP